jgi:hypothetical protein
LVINGVLESYPIRPPTRRTLVGLGSDAAFRWIRVAIAGRVGTFPVRLAISAY